MPDETPVIRVTQSTCPRCLERIEARVIERDGCVYLEKECPEHGAFSLLLSCHPWYYRGLSGMYFSLFPRSLPQKDYIVQLTNRCGLSCPICLASANTSAFQDYPRESLRAFLKGKRGFKLDLMGAEPTMREDLAQVIRLVKASGNIPVLHTNGIRITDLGYLESLKKAGLRGVCLQFDGLDEKVYEKLRGRPLLDLKLRALENLERANIATDLIVTVARGVNEGEMERVLRFALGRGFVKGVFFLGCRRIGKARELSPALCIMPDELIDLLERQTGGRISRKAVYGFQKLYFALLAAFSVRKCFYIHHFLIARDGDGYISCDRLLDLGRLERSLEKFCSLYVSGSAYATFYLCVVLLKGLSRHAFFWLKEFLWAALWKAGLAHLRKKSLIVGFISSCDAYSFDSVIARNCGKGTVSLELGVQPSGAEHNLMAEGYAAAEQVREE